MASIITPKFRVSYPNLFKPKRNELNGKDEFSLVAVFPKGADISALQEAAKKCAEEKWGPDSKKWPKNLRSPFRSHDEKAAEDESGKKVYPMGMEPGGVFMNLKSTQKPGVVDESVEPIIDQHAIYGGCYARASVSFYAYSQSGNNGIGCGLRNVQKMGDGEAFGGKTKPEDDFAPIEGVEKADAGELFQ